MAELKNWEQKKELMIRKRELKVGIFIGFDKDGKRNAGTAERQSEERER